MDTKVCFVHLRFSNVFIPFVIFLIFFTYYYKNRQTTTKVYIIFKLFKLVINHSIQHMSSVELTPAHDHEIDSQTLCRQYHTSRRFDMIWRLLGL